MKTHEEQIEKINNEEVKNLLLEILEILKKQKSNIGIPECFKEYSNISRPKKVFTFDWGKEPELETTDVAPNQYREEFKGKHGICGNCGNQLGILPGGIGKCFNCGWCKFELDSLVYD